MRAKRNQHVEHIAIEKEELLRTIRERGVGSILQDWQGTDAEAIDAIEADARTSFVFEPSCDAQREDGTCAGHRREY